MGSDRRGWSLRGVCELVVETEVAMVEDNEPVMYMPPDDEETGSPLVDAMNKFFRDVPTLHDPAEVQAFLKSVDGLPTAADRIEKFMQEIAARYEKWIRENRSDQG